jgi:hypothetical protein
MVERVEVLPFHQMRAHKWASPVTISLPGTETNADSGTGAAGEKPVRITRALGDLIF